jgi:SPP1 family predicted phage head-tail adaptor
MALAYPYGRIKDPLSLPAGLLRNPVLIQAQSMTQDAVGGPLTAWTTVLSCFAGISTMSSREVYQTAQFVSEVTHRVTIRWPGPSVSIQGGMQVVFGSRIFKIQNVENVQERNRVLYLMCVEINGVQ